MKYLNNKEMVTTKETPFAEGRSLMSDYLHTTLTWSYSSYILEFDFIL